MLDWARERYPKEPGDSDFVYKQTIKAKACDAAARHPARGDAVERRHLRHRPGVRGAAAAHARAPAARGARSTPTMMLEELRKVIPSFLARVDREDRGVAWSDYLAETRARDREPSSSASSATSAPEPRPAVTLTDFDPDAEDKLLAAICYPHTHLPDDQVLATVRTPERRRPRRAAATRTSGSARNRRHKPGPRRSSASTTASTSSPTTARSATCNGTGCSPSSGSRSRTLHGYDVPEAVDEAGLRDRFDEAMATLGRALRRAARAVPRAGVVRGVARVPHPVRDADERARSDAPARAAHHAVRATPRTARSCQEMHRLIAEQAGHRAIAAAMSHVDHTTYELERLAAERAADARRSARPV